MPKVVSLHALPPTPVLERTKPPPKHLERPERELWRQLTIKYRLDEAALVILGEALTSLMRARRCREQIAREGEVVEDAFGRRAHPLLTAEKTSRQAFMSAMKALRLGFVS